MAVKFANNVSTTLASAIDATQTTISVADASGLPTLSSGDYIYLTIDTDTASPTIEVVKVTAISSNDLTVVRGQDGTTASSFSNGTKVELRVTAAALDDIAAAGLPADGDGSDLQNVRAETVEVNIKNVSGSSIAKGTPVHQTGTSGAATFEVTPALAGTASTMPAHFIAAETLADQAEGRGILMGRISGVDTSSFSEGDTIYVGASGGFVNTPPTGEGNLVQNLGTVTRVDATNGGGEVYGAGRSNATPNLNDGNIFIGNSSNQASTASLSTSVSGLSHYNDTNWNTAYTYSQVGHVPLAGGTMTGDLSFGDNDKAIFGSSDNLRIFHDGTTGHIRSTTSNIELRFNGGGNFKVGDEFGNHYLIVNDNSDVQLYHGQPQTLKLATSATGIDVTGSVSADGFILDGTTVIDSTRRLTPTGIQMSPDTGLYGTDATLSYYSSSNAVYLNGAGADGWLRLNASGASNDRTAINLFGSNQGDNITFKTAGTQRMNIDSSGVLRWGSGNTAILDASFNLQNIGTISSGAITSSGNITTSGVLQVNVGSASHTRFRITRPSSTTAALYMGVDSSNNAMMAANNSALRIGKDVAGTFYEYLTVESGGNTNVKNALEINGTTRIDASGNATLGTISGSLVSSVTATTQSASDNSTKVATTAYVDSAVSGIVDSAPGTLDTLNELAAALGDDANFSTTVTNSIATKLPLAGGTMTGRINFFTTNVQAPSSTNATTGARLNLYPQGSGRDYTIGIESSNMWFNTDGGFKWYEDGAARMQMETGGHLNLSTGSLKMNGTTVIDSSRRNIYLDSFAGGDGHGIHFRTGFTSTSNKYNASITVQDHNGSSADGLHISGYDGVGIGTGANTYNVKLLVHNNGNVGIGTGTATPSKTLHVKTTGNEGIRLEGTQNGVWMDVQSSNSELWSMGADTNGWAIYNRTDSAYRLRVENGGDVDIVSGGLKVGASTVIDSSRNMSNIGTIDADGLYLNDLNGTVDSRWGIYAWDQELQFTRRNISSNAYISAPMVLRNDDASARFSGPIWVNGSQFVDTSRIVTTPKINVAGGSYEGSIVFGTNNTWHCGIRQHDDADAEMRIWHKNANGMIFLATGYDGEPASISRPTDGLVVQSNNVGIGNFSSVDPAQKLHVKSTSDAQLRLDGDGTTWAGIHFVDSGGADYMWFHGATDTWSFGGGGSSSNSEKRIHAHGGVSIGAGLQNSTVPTNGLGVEGDAHVSGNIQIRNASPTIYLRDTNHISSMIHQNSNLFYVLRADASDDNGWTTFSSGAANNAGDRWPLEMNLTNSSNYVRFGSSNLQAGGYTVWHTGNDGPSSGLDADTLDTLQASAFARSNTAWTSAAAWKQTFHSGSGGATFPANHYSMGVDYANGAWSNPNYSDLIIGYHTGIRIGAGYSGIRFYNNSPTTDANNDGNGDGSESLLMTIGGGGTATSGANVTINNDLYMGDNVHVSANKGFVTDGAWIRNKTAHGYIDIGPANSGHAHIYTDRSNFYFNRTLIYADGNTMWHAGNDGAGSGLDADTLDTYQASHFALYDHIRSLGTQALNNGDNPYITTSQVMDEIDGFGGFDSYTSVFKTSWSYAGNYNLTDAGRFSETAGTSWITWTDNSSDSARGNITALAIAPNTGGSAGRVFIYNNQGSSYSPGWREVWTSTSDGAGSGLDADLLDGHQGDTYVGKLGGTYYQASTWIQLTGNHGLYCPTINDFHLRANQESSYGGMQLMGSRNGYYGIQLSGSGGTGNNAAHVMFDSNGNGGFWNNSKSWGLYYNRGNHCMAIGGSYTTSSYGIYEQGGGIYSSGNVTASGFLYSSDRAFKKNIKPIKNALETVSALQGVTYVLKKTEEDSVGFIAQDVEQVVPELVKGEEGEKTVNYGQMVALLTEAIKEQQAQIESLKAEIAEMKNAN